MKKVLLLNGPPNSGKDEVAKILCPVMNASHQMFKESLYEETLKYYELERFPLYYENDHSIWYVKDNIQDRYEWFIDRELKETPCPDFGGKTPREALIHVSEDIIKPKHGKKYFGQKAVERLTEGWNIFSDSGFNEEAEAVCDETHSLQDKES